MFIEPSVQTFVLGQPGSWTSRLALHQRADDGDARRARLPLPAPQRELLLRAQHVHGRDGDRARRLHRVFPTAPPRFLPEWGFVDSVAEFTGVAQDSVAVDALFNPYAAVPSMHVGFALMIGSPLARLVKHACGSSVFWASYPLLVTFVIVATANHFVADAVLGARHRRRVGVRRRSWLARARPAAWAFSPGGARPSQLRLRWPAATHQPRAAASGASCVRNRLIESRLTPNAISLTGLVLNLVAAVLVWRRAASSLGGIAFIVGSVLRHARRALLADVGQGHAVRRVPGLDARPHRGGHRARPRSRRTSPRRASASRPPPCVVAVLASLMVSYTRARAEALGVECKVGIAQPCRARGDPLRRPILLGAASESC